MTDFYVPVEETHYPYYVAVRFEGGSKSYFFGTDDQTLAIHDRVVVDSNSGYEIATVTQESRSTENFKSAFPLAPVIRRADEEDEKDYALSKEESQNALEITREEVAKLGLPMHLMEARYNLDGSKCTITYTADNRVDFRELLKVLAPKLHARIDLRQVAPRDKAKMVGGVGPCGLTLCCSTFLTSFEGISINRAKNQMLSLNIPKLSGLCGKLKCCLAYEDDLYTEEKKNYPRIGSLIKLREGTYKVESFNILSRKIHLSKEGERLDLTLEEYNERTNPNYVRPIPPKAPVDPMPEISFGDDKDAKKGPTQGQKPFQKDGGNKPNGSRQDDRRNNQRNSQRNGRNFQQRRPNDPNRGQQGKNQNLNQNQNLRQNRNNGGKKPFNNAAKGNKKPDDKKGF